MKFGSDKYYESDEWQELRQTFHLLGAVTLGLFQIGDGELLVKHGDRNDWERAICVCIIDNKDHIGKHERINVLYMLEHTN